MDTSNGNLNMLRICDGKPSLYYIRGMFNLLPPYCMGFKIFKKVPEKDKDPVVGSIVFEKGISDEDDIFFTQINPDFTFSTRHFISLEPLLYRPFTPPKNSVQYFYNTKHDYDIGWIECSSVDCSEEERKIRNKKLSKKIVMNNGAILCYRAKDIYYKICTVTINDKGELDVKAPKTIEVKIKNGIPYIGI